MFSSVTMPMYLQFVLQEWVTETKDEALDGHWLQLDTSAAGTEAWPSESTGAQMEDGPGAGGETAAEPASSSNRDTMVYDPET